MKMNFSIPVVALVLGTALGYCLHSSDSPKEVSPGKGRVTKKPIAEVGDAEVRALRLRIKELERMLTAKAPTTNAKAAAQEPPSVPGMQGRPPFANFLENLKKNDPKRYAAMTNDFARMRRNMQRRSQAKYDFLTSLDTTSMSSEDRAGVERLQELIARREELADKMRSSGVTNEERQKIFDEMRDLNRQMRKENSKVRQSLLKETARSTGLDDEAAAAMTETIGEIIEATENGFGPPPSPEGMPPGPPPEGMPQALGR